MIMILGLTGNIASGKSTVAGYFAEAGARLLSADRLAREVVCPGSQLLRQVVARFGAEVLQANGELNREVLSELIFADPQARQALNAMLHPAIAELSRQRLAELNADAASLVVYESPLLFEAAAEGRVDKILVVTIDPQQQLQRLMQRDAIDEQTARSRIASQMPQDEKACRADFVIDNSGTPEDCRRQVFNLAQNLYSQIRGRSKSH